MSNKDFRTDLDGWIDMWVEMQPEIEAQEPAIQQEETPFVGGDSTQDAYYDYLDSEELFQEQATSKPRKTQRTPNPVYPDSTGPDYQDPKSVWVSEELLKTVEGLKQRLFKVENYMARMGQGKKFSEKAVVDDGTGGKLVAEIKSLRAKIEQVSSQLGIKDEPSPYKVQRD